MEDTVKLPFICSQDRVVPVQNQRTVCFSRVPRPWKVGSRCLGLRSSDPIPPAWEQTPPFNPKGQFWDLSSPALASVMKDWHAQEMTGALRLEHSLSS